jgi:hypothetical protein
MTRSDLFLSTNLFYWSKIHLLNYLYNLFEINLHLSIADPYINTQNYLLSKAWIHQFLRNRLPHLAKGNWKRSASREKKKKVLRRFVYFSRVTNKRCQENKTTKGLKDKEQAMLLMTKQRK